MYVYVYLYHVNSNNLLLNSSFIQIHLWGFLKSKMKIYQTVRVSLISLNLYYILYVTYVPIIFCCKNVLAIRMIWTIFKTFRIRKLIIFFGNCGIYENHEYFEQKNALKCWRKVMFSLLDSLHISVFWFSK